MQKVIEKDVIIDDRVNTRDSFRFSSLVYFLSSLLELLLFLRFILKLFGANTSSEFVQVIYSSSEIFVAPFYNIFPVVNIYGYLFESATLVAILVYSILTYLFVRFLDVLLSR